MCREQKLIDILFQIVRTIEVNNDNWVENTDLIEWTRSQLEGCGFELTKPIGSSYGLLKNTEYYKNNAEEDYIKTPISVLRYITELEEKQKNI